MSDQRKQGGLWAAIIISAIVLGAAVIWAVAKRQGGGRAHTEHQHSHGLVEPSPLEGNKAVKADRELNNLPEIRPSETKGNESAKPDSESDKLTLDDIIRAARTWGPIHQSWYGKGAPEFTLTDITGKEHKLSDYRGKDVMLVFWATWCGPCIREVPHLIALQNIMGKDKLAILAISYISPVNTAEMVKNFVEQNRNINYTVFSVDRGTMPRPFDLIEGIPTSFFVNREGKIKLATTGLLSLGYMKAILQAE